MRRRALLRAVAGGALAAPVAGCTTPAMSGVIEYDDAPDAMMCYGGSLPADLAVQNRHDDPVSVDVTLDAEGESESHDRTVSLDPWGQRVMNQVGTPGERYELRVDLDGATETWEWTVEDCRRLQLRVHDAETVTADVVEPLSGGVGYSQHNCYPGERKQLSVANYDTRSHTVDLRVEGPAVDVRESFSLGVSAAPVESARLVTGEAYEATVEVSGADPVEMSWDDTCAHELEIHGERDVRLTGPGIA